MLPLSYAVDAMQAAGRRREARPARSGATSAVVVGFALVAAGPRRCAPCDGVRRNLCAHPAGPARRRTANASAGDTAYLGMSSAPPAAAAARRSDQVKKLVSTHAGVRGHRHQLRARRETTERRRRDRRRWSTTGCTVTLDFLGEDTLDVAQADATVAAYLDVLAELGRARPGPQRRGVGQAVARSARRCPTTATRSPSRTPATICRAARNAGTTVTLDMEDHTTTDSTLRDPARAAQGLPRDRRRAAGLPAPHRGRLPRAGLRGLAGCGCARAPTRSPRRSPSRTRTTSTSPTCAASRC